MNSHKQLKMLTAYLTILILLSGCATDQNHKYMPHKENSYVVRGHNYSFAIYNGEHRLLTHPVEELLTEMKWRKSLDKPAISDIYLVSHGWNYTLPVAIANYHSYMERIDAFVEKQKNSLANQDRCKPSVMHNNDVSNSCFQPYFIFVTWTSTTRPTTDLVKAVLPFGMDSAVEPLTNVVDKIPLHIFTVWKESLNASMNALGTHNPNYYIGKDWGDQAYGYQDSNLIEDADSTMGEDLPLSALIYKLIQQKKEDKQALEKTPCNKPDPFSPADDVCVPLAQTKLHLVGHSYGAKLVALAGMEALRRWLLEDHEPDWKKLHELAISPKTGHYFLGTEVLGHRDASPPVLLNEWYKNTRLTPIDSLVLFNPAFHPGELSYPVDQFHSSPTETLKFIPRKAIVYTNNDYANGGLFVLRELMLNGQLSQWFQQNANGVDQYFADFTHNYPAGIVTYPFFKMFQGVSGVMGLGEGVVESQLGYAFHTVTNLPFDFMHHIRTGTLDGWFSPESDSELSFKSLGKNLANSVDFFLPIKLTRMFGNPTQGLSLNSPLVFQRDEAEQGAFRLSRSGLGKTGLNHLAEGRWAQANLSGLADYYCDPSDKGSCQKEGYSDEQLKNIDLKSQGRSLSEFTPFAPNIDPETFCRFNSKPSLTQAGFKSDFEPEKLLWLREKFYSFDASKVYDSKMPPVGAHSDLRETGIPDADNCWNVSEECQRLEKRDYTFNFMLNFTKTDFEKELCELNPKEMQKYGVICSSKESGK